MLDIQKHQIGDGHQLVCFFGMLWVEQDPAGIQRRVDPVLFGLGKQFGEEIDLQHRFAAGSGDAAGFVKADGDDLLRRHLGAARRLPGIGIMAVQAPHGAALEKHHIADPGAVHRAEAFQRMNPSRHHILSWKVREMTSSCWARVSLMKFTA